jgi:hypothetical protein
MARQYKQNAKSVPESTHRAGTRQIRGHITKNEALLPKEVASRLAKGVVGPGSVATSPNLANISLQPVKRVTLLGHWRIIVIIDLQDLHLCVCGMPRSKLTESS